MSKVISSSEPDSKSMFSKGSKLKSSCGRWMASTKPSNMTGSVVLTSSIGKGSYSRGESPSSVDDSWVDVGSSKLGGDGTADEVCVVGACWVVVVEVLEVFFLPAGSTAANASMPLATF